MAAAPAEAGGSHTAGVLALRAAAGLCWAPHRWPGPGSPSAPCPGLSSAPAWVWGHRSQPPSQPGPALQAFSQKQKQTKGILEGRETLAGHRDCFAVFVILFCSLSFLNGVIWGGVGSRRFAPSPLRHSGRGAGSGAGPGLPQPPYLPPARRCLLFPQDQGAAWAGGGVGDPAHAWHLLLALWWLLSNQGLTASALTKAEARVPLSSLCFDPRPGSRRCRAGGREQRGGADLLWAWHQHLNGFSGDR